MVEVYLFYIMDTQELSYQPSTLKRVYKNYEEAVRAVEKINTPGNLWERAYIKPIEFIE